MNILVINCSPVRNGVTSKMTEVVAQFFARGNQVKNVSIDDYEIQFCRGCRVCHETAECVLSDGVKQLMAEYEWADTILCVSPSYWADIPGQFKAFIDRCTPWCNTHEPHARLSPGKRGYTIAIRTGQNPKECERVVSSIEHFHGHLEIESRGSLCLTGVSNRLDAMKRMDRILEFCRGITDEKD